MALFFSGILECTSLKSENIHINHWHMLRDFTTSMVFMLYNILFIELLKQLGSNDLLIYRMRCAKKISSHCGTGCFLNGQDSPGNVCIPARRSRLRRQLGDGNDSIDPDDEFQSSVTCGIP